MRFGVQVEQQKMRAGDLKQQLAVATAEAAEHKQKAIQASALVESLQTQVNFSPCCNGNIPTCWLDLHYMCCCTSTMSVRCLDFAYKLVVGNSVLVASELFCPVPQFCVVP